MLINWNSYVIDLTYNGSDFFAKRLDDDKRWKRIYPDRWHTEFCCTEHDTELIAILEQGVRDYQALHTPTLRPQRRAGFLRRKPGPRAPIAGMVRRSEREWKGEAR